MAVRKIAISLEPDLADDIALAASRECTSVSRWLAAAARERMRHQAALDAVKAYEEESGAFSEEQLERARRSWLQA